jgi:hypothetical protein
MGPNNTVRTSGAVQQLRPHDVVAPVVYLTNVKPRLGRYVNCNRAHSSELNPVLQSPSC